MTDDEKAQAPNAREEQTMSNENDEQNSAEVTGYELGKAVAKVVAEHTGLKPEEIVELHITADSTWVIYARLEDIHTRTRRIDAETGATITDRDGRF